jgi:hypothetical protein
VALRRDLADLNAQYLELGLLAGSIPDACFGWSEAVHRCIAETDAASRARMATSPFALFHVAIPGTPPWEHPPRVEDGLPTAVAGPFHARCLSFAHQVAFLAMRLVEGSPLAGRLVLGLSPAGEAWLRELRPSQVADVAADPGLIRPRWPTHVRFWAMFAGAARRASPEALRWTHCVGLCLLGSDEATPPAGDATARRGARRGVPCRHPARTLTCAPASYRRPA